MALDIPRYPMNRLLDQHWFHIPRAGELNEEQHDVADTRGNVRHLLETAAEVTCSSEEARIASSSGLRLLHLWYLERISPQSLPVNRSGDPSRCPPLESKYSTKEVRSIL